MVEPQNITDAWEQAYLQTMTSVYAPTFFAKLAHDYGIVPSNEDDQYALLEIASMLRQNRNLGETAASGALREACEGLKEAMQATGVNHGLPSMDAVGLAREAQLLAADPSICDTIYNFGLLTRQLQTAAAAQ